VLFSWVLMITLEFNLCCYEFRDVESESESLFKNLKKTPGPNCLIWTCV